MVVNVMKQKYAEAIGSQSSQAANAKAPMNIKPKIRIRLTVIGTMTRSVGMYRSFPTSSNASPLDFLSTPKK